MLKKTLLSLMLSACAIIPFTGAQVTAATPDVQTTDELAYRGWGGYRGFGYGGYGYSGYGYGGYGYGGYGYGGGSGYSSGCNSCGYGGYGYGGCGCSSCNSGCGCGFSLFNIFGNWGGCGCGC